MLIARLFTRWNPLQMNADIEKVNLQQPSVQCFTKSPLTKAFAPFSSLARQEILVCRISLNLFEASFWNTGTLGEMGTTIEKCKPTKNTQVKH